MLVTVGVSSKLHSSLPRPWGEDAKFMLCLWASFTHSLYQIYELGMMILTEPGKDWIISGCHQQNQQQEPMNID